MPSPNHSFRPVVYDAKIRSYGRLQGRKLTALQMRLLSDVLPTVAVPIEDATIDPLSLFAHNPKQIWLEIGFGAGEHLAAQAAQHSDVGIIGCEPFINGVALLLRQVETKKLQNVRILHGDVRVLLEKLVPHSLDRVLILFPDPWPKARHHRKRLVCADTLDMLTKVMKPGAQLDIATDHADYALWIEEHLKKHTGFVEVFDAKQRLIQPEGWVKTKYQQKAEQQGRHSVFFRVKSK